MPRIGRSESRPARREAAALALALVAAAGFGTARLASARRICCPRLQVVGIPADVGARPARCTDGDPFCDADGAADAKCDFRVRLCFDGGPGEECDPDDVKRMSIVPTRGLEALSASLDALKAARTPATLCTQAASVPVAVPRRKKGRLVLKMHTARAGARLTFVCQLPRRSSVFLTIATLQHDIFNGTCATASCHDATAAGGLDLSEHASFANLVDVPPANPAAQAAGRLRVVPRDPDQSFLLAKLLGQLGPGEGSRMPLVGRPLSPAAIDLVRRWIAAGAPGQLPF